MPDKATMDRAMRDKKQGKSASTQAGEFVRKEIDNIGEGKHGAKNTKQAIAIGLSEARRAGVDLPQPKKGTVSEKTRANAKRDTEKGQRHEPVSKTRSAAAKRTASDRSKAAKKAARTRAGR